MSSLKDKTVLIPDTSPGNALGEERNAALFKDRSAANPARRIGTADDIAGTAPMALTIDRRSDDVGSAPGGQAGR